MNSIARDEQAGGDLPERFSNARLRRVYQERQPNALVVNIGRLGIAVGIFGVWELLGRTHVLNPGLWSMPSLIWAEIVRTFHDGSLWDNASFTFTSTILGFVIGTSAGSMLGLSFWWSTTYAKIFEPYLVIFESIPKLALAPIVVLVLGIGLESKVGMAVALTLVISAFTTYTGMRAVDRDLVRMVFSLGGTRWQVFSKVIVPGALPAVLSALRINIGLALTGAIVGEFIGSKRGLGRSISYGAETYNIALIWAGVFTLSLLGVALYFLTTWVENTAMRGFTHERFR